MLEGWRRNYHSGAKKFRTHFFNDQGLYDEAGSTYEGVVAAGKLTFTGPARFQYELDDDGKIKVNPNSTITVVWWLRDLEGVWKFWRDATYTKVKNVDRLRRPLLWTGRVESASKSKLSLIKKEEEP